MKNRLYLFIIANCLLLGVSILQANAFKVLDYDLTVAESKKHEKHWEKGGESDFFHKGHEEKGEKGDKGYESKHG